MFRCISFAYFYLTWLWITLYLLLTFKFLNQFCTIYETWHFWSQLNDELSKTVLSKLFYITCETLKTDKRHPSLFPMCRDTLFGQHCSKGLDFYEIHQKFLEMLQEFSRIFYIFLTLFTCHSIHFKLKVQ